MLQTRPVIVPKLKKSIILVIKRILSRVLLTLSTTFAREYIACLLVEQLVGGVGIVNI
jgi:hypothetical protein